MSIQIIKFTHVKSTLICDVINAHMRVQYIIVELLMLMCVHTHNRWITLFVIVSLLSQGAYHHVTGANVYTAAAKRCGTWG